LAQHGALSFADVRSAVHQKMRLSLWENANNYLIWIKRVSGRLEEKLFQINTEKRTLNQRVQGSSPCAPTSKINDLAVGSSDK
jgi:hypothetical protein